MLHADLLYPGPESMLWPTLFLWLTLSLDPCHVHHAVFTNLVSSIFLQELAEADVAKEQIEEVQVRNCVAWAGPIKVFQLWIPPQHVCSLLHNTLIHQVQARLCACHSIWQTRGGTFVLLKARRSRKAPSFEDFLNRPTQPGAACAFFVLIVPFMSCRPCWQSVAAASAGTAAACKIASASSQVDHDILASSIARHLNGSCCN